MNWTGNKFEKDEPLSETPRTVLSGAAKIISTGVMLLKSQSVLFWHLPEIDENQ